MSSPRAIKGERDHRHKLSFGHPVIQEQSRASRSNLEETPAHARSWAIHFTAITRRVPLILVLLVRGSFATWRPAIFPSVLGRMKRLTQSRNQQRKIQQTPGRCSPKIGINRGCAQRPIEDERSVQPWAS
jgi:hypothetical protein